MKRKLKVEQNTKQNKVEIEYEFHDEKAYAILRRPAENKKTNPCPFCWEGHIHGEGDGHRVAHCYKVRQPVILVGNVVLRQEDGYIVITGEKS